MMIPREWVWRRLSSNQDRCRGLSRLPATIIPPAGYMTGLCHAKAYGFISILRDIHVEYDQPGR